MNDKSGWERLTHWIPGLRLFSEYQRSFLGADLMAGLVVALVVIPSAIAYANLANCPPIAGLYAALAGMIVFPLFTSSRHVIVGPDAAIAILVADAKRRCAVTANRRGGTKAAAVVGHRRHGQHDSDGDDDELHAGTCSANQRFRMAANSCGDGSALHSRRILPSGMTQNRKSAPLSIA